MYQEFIDLSKLITDGERESYELEFKSGDKELRGNKVWLGKSCSAFANAGGGNLIYGIQEKKTEDGINCAGMLVPVRDNSITEDSLTQHIASTTEPPLRDFSVKAIRCEDNSIPGTIFVITVRQSTTAHQFKPDYIYYRRVGAITVKMHDYEIRDVMNRRVYSLVDVQVHSRQNYHISHKSQTEYQINVSLGNEGNITVSHWMLELGLPTCLISKNQFLYLLEYKALVFIWIN